MNVKNKILSFVLIVPLLLGAFIFMPTQYNVQAAVVTNTEGYSSRNQTVYSGPGTFYATAGSINQGEHVYIIEKEPDNFWYHIVYAVGNEGAQKSGYVPVDSLYNISGSIQTTNYNGGQCYANEDMTTYTTYAFEMVSGSISRGEGVTLLYQFTFFNGVGNYRVSFIKYSTSSGPKRAYTTTDDLTKENRSNVARVLYNADLYYLNSTSSAKAGSVDAGEFVSVICKNGDWVYVEYNTASGRKRGCFSVGNLQLYVSGFEYDDFYNYYNSPPTTSTESRIYVYAGPSYAYPVIGYIENENYKSYTTTWNDNFYYIIYSTSSGSKVGWIPPIN